jgi:hypothetical protein
MDRDTMRQYLEGVGFPATRDDVLRWAREHGASTEEIEVMRRLPMERYESITDVLNAATGRG